MPDTHILVIDDEKNILTTFKQALELEGYKVSVAGSGEIGLEKVADEKPDLVLLDLILPGIDGIEVLKRIKKENTHLPVIMMSGHGSIQQALEAVRLGAVDFLEKPLSPDKAAITIQNVLKLSDLDEETRSLRDQLDERYRIIGESGTLIDLLDKADRAAPTRSRVLIAGESGTGKELIARRIHRLSDRAGKPFVKVNCAAIPSELIESELFGHKKGSFTGAISDREGKFKKADKGTIFLDEIGDMKMEMQAKLLRVLQEGEFEPVGSDKTIGVDVRVISATNKDLKKEIEEGNFREDLYYRLNAFPISVPPLRERAGDIPMLADHFVRFFCEENNKKIKVLEPDAMALLKKQPWQGNVRQLKNLCEQLVILSNADVITAKDVKPLLYSEDAGRTQLPIPVDQGLPLKDMVNEAEKGIILYYLKKNDWNMAETAEDLRLERSHLYKKCKSLGIEY